MDFKTFGVAEGEHIPGKVVHEYFERYAREFHLFEKIRFESRVVSVSLEDDATWLVNVTTRKRGRYTLRARKLVLATGITTDPNLPVFTGAADFGGPILHSKDVRLSQSKPVERVAVVGGAKSAADAVYIHATSGKHVDWIIRGEKTSSDSCWH